VTPLLSAALTLGALYFVARELYGRLIACQPPWGGLVDWLCGASEESL
jgi:hypothetical protein